MSGTPIRVRIAPSPTGFAHVGTAYTALFNFAYARKNNGKFILRLEDTDVARHVEGAEEAIYDGLNWLGLTWDEGPKLPAGKAGNGGKYGPYRQSERLPIYKKKAEELLGKDFAYKDEGAVKFKSKFKSNKIGWIDVIRGKVEFPVSEISDFVIIKSDGYPTYNFAVVVDDALMEISHVIRGEEHISNTPRQLALYDAFKISRPEFAHLPTLRNKDRKKLSKRLDPVDLKKYQNEGYLPEALINFLCLLGWSHPEEKEIFGLNEFVKLFDLKRVRKAGPIFNIEKLEWINKQYLIKQAEERPKEFVSYASNVSIYSGKPNFEQVGLGTATIISQRIDKFQEYDNMVRPYYETPKTLDTKNLSTNKKVHLEESLKFLKSLGEWDDENINEGLLGLAKEKKYNLREFFMDLRIALTGETVGVPLGNLISNLTKKETVHRIKKLI